MSPAWAWIKAHWIPVYLVLCVLVSAGTLLRCEVNAFGWVRVRHSPTYTWIAFLAVCRAVTDASNQSVPYLLLAYVPKLTHAACTAVANKCTRNANVVAAVASAGALSAVFAVFYGIHVAFAFIAGV